MAKSKKRLGRGLDSLISRGISKSKKKVKKRKTIPKATKKKSVKKAGIVKGARSQSNNTKGQRISEKKDHRTVSENGFLEIPLSKIQTNPYQPRRVINHEQISELADSIRSEGLLQPIVVRNKRDGFEIIAGERRFRACKELNLRTIPARVMKASDSSSAVMTMIENLQREGLNPVDEALGYASLIRDFDLTQERVSERVGKGRATVANSLRLLQLEEEIQGFLSMGLMSAGQAKALLGIDDQEQRLILARRIIEEGLSVRETERLTKKVKSSKVVSISTRPMTESESVAVQDLEKKISSQLNTKVLVRHTSKKGKIVIEYYGNEDLQRILEKLQLAQ